MKNAVILHGTNASPQDNWFPWLKEELENKNYKVWVPDLPQADHPNIKRYNEFLLSQNWKFDEETILIGHSSGAVEILGLLQELSEDIIIDKAILVAGFINDLGWDSLNELFLKPFDYEKIKKHAQKFIIIQSDNDPYVPAEHAKFLADKLNAELLMQHDEGHFSIENDSKYNQFPFLLKLID